MTPDIKALMTTAAEAVLGGDPDAIAKAEAALEALRLQESLQTAQEPAEAPC